MKVKLIVRYQLTHGGTVYDQALFSKETSTATLEDLKANEKILVAIRSDGEPSDKCVISGITRIDGKESIIRHIHAFFKVELALSPEGTLPIDLELERLFYEVIPRMEKNGYRIESITPAVPARKFYSRPEISGWLEKRWTTDMMVEGQKPRTKYEQDEEVESAVNAALSIEREKILANIQDELIKPMFRHMVMRECVELVVEETAEGSGTIVSVGEILTPQKISLIVEKSHRLKIIGSGVNSEIGTLVNQARRLTWKLMGEMPYKNGTI